MNNHLWKFENVELDGISEPRLKNISVHIEKGVTAILGHSGAGKSSMINLLTEFEKPSKGHVGFDLSVSGNRLPLFWVPQDDGLWPQLTVLDHLKIVVSDDGDTKNQLQDYLNAFDLYDLRERKPESLSQGERSRLSVARAIASGAEVIVMDEPLAHVDYRKSVQYWDVIQKYMKDHDSSLVFASHMSETVLRESEYCLCLENGEIVYMGKTEELYDHPPSEAVAWFLGPVNWLDSAEAERWLGVHSENDIKVRPDQIMAIEEEASGLSVVRSGFAGTHSQVHVKHEQSGVEKTIYTKTDCRNMKAGSKVRFSILALLLMVFCFTGCEQSDDPVLSVKEVDVWMLPEDGRSIPTPRSMTISDDNELLILDDAGRVLVYDLEGKLLRQWNMPESDVGNPEGIAVLPDKRVVVADTHYHRVVFFDLQGKVLGMFGKEGENPGEFIYPVGVTCDDKGNYYIAEYGSNDRLQKFSADDEFILELGKPGTDDGEFQRMSGMVWHDGFLYISDAINNRIQKFTDTGNFVEIMDLTDYGTSLRFPYDISLASDGGFWVVEYGAGRLTKISLDGKLIGRFGKTGSDLNELTTPWGLTASKDGRVFIADTGNRRVMEVRF